MIAWLSELELHSHINWMPCRPVRRILKSGVQSTAWPLGHGEGEGAGGVCAPSRTKRKAFTLWMI